MADPIVPRPAQPAYLVQRFNGRAHVACETEAEVWEAIGASWAPYQVSSPRGLRVDQFVPF